MGVIKLLGKKTTINEETLIPFDIKKKKDACGNKPKVNTYLLFRAEKDGTLDPENKGEEIYLKKACDKCSKGSAPTWHHFKTDELLDKETSDWCTSFLEDEYAGNKKDLAFRGIEQYKSARNRGILAGFLGFSTFVASVLAGIGKERWNHWQEKWNDLSEDNNDLLIIGTSFVTVL